MTLITGLSALKTDLARKMEARAVAEGVALGDWSFQVGTGGYNPASPDQVTVADPSLQVLVAAVGGSRPLGRLVASGAGAVLTPSGVGTVVVTGLSGIPDWSPLNWIRVTGSGDANANGTWVIRRWISATSVEIENPLQTVLDAGPRNWEFRQACVGRPNARASSFFARLLKNDATSDGHEYGEIGIFCRVLRAPTDPPLVGSPVLYCVAHHVGQVKTPDGVIDRHVVCQF
jgi:hypothetical protein